ncbi:hypothetical protein DL768_007265 [Monosporascus sp. mg162]|nr:hypothetical protein DL768_007265 [Monosporascus sp. mg162]
MTRAHRIALRAEWDNKKEGIEKQLSDPLTISWTVDIKPNQVYFYTKDKCEGAAGNYVEGAIQRLKESVDNYGADGVRELDTICYTHVPIIDLDDAKQSSYCGTDVNGGRLRVLRSTTQPVPEDSDAALNYAALSFGGADGHPQPDIQLNPNFVDSFAKLLAESKVRKTELRPDWQGYLGYFTLL